MSVVWLALALVSLALAAHPFTTCPLSLALLRRRRIGAWHSAGRGAPASRFSLLVCAHNEEEVIADKIANLSALLDCAPDVAELLPNRLYEGSYFGAPALAARGTMTGERIEKLGIGWTFDEPIEDGVIGLLQGLERDAYVAVRRHLLGLPTSLFVDEGDVVDLCRRILAMRPERRSAGAPRGPEEPKVLARPHARG